MLNSHFVVAAGKNKPRRSPIVPVELCLFTDLGDHRRIRIGSPQIFLVRRIYKEDRLTGTLPLPEPPILPLSYDPPGMYDPHGNHHRPGFRPPGNNGRV
jgi:hypothetical protein